VAFVVDKNLHIIFFVNKRNSANVSIIFKTKLMMSRKSNNVVPCPNGGWKIRQSGASKASNVFDTKQPAIARARDLSTRQHTELVIHNKNGKISGKDNDPCPPRE
jgi:hypothetical protein